MIKPQPSRYFLQLPAIETVLQILAEALRNAAGWPRHASMRIVALLVLIGAAPAAAPGWAAEETDAAPQIVLAGTGNPNLDVAAVQAAVDRGGQVRLQGHFSFDQPPTRSTPPQAFFPRVATVLVSKAVEISGSRDARGEMTTIDRGTWPFVVEAPGARVTIQGLRFVRPKAGAIQVNVVSGLVIADCRIEGLEPLPNPDMRGSPVGMGIGISTSPKPPSPSAAGRPEDVSGILSIVNNHIDAIGGTSNDLTLGILIFSVGKLPGQAVELYVSGNRINNVTERAVNVRQLGGRGYIDWNAITTGGISGAAVGVAPDAIHVFGAGSYVVAHNSIQSGWAKGAGIRVHGGFAEWPVVGAIVVDNDVNMQAPADAAAGADGVGIEIRGAAQRNVVLNNRIRGRGRAALAVIAQSAGAPDNNDLVSNGLEDFEASLAGVLVDTGVTGTRVVGQASGQKWKSQDGGVGTVIVRLGGADK